MLGGTPTQDMEGRHKTIQRCHRRLGDVRLVEEFDDQRQIHVQPQQVSSMHLIAKSAVPRNTVAEMEQSLRFDQSLSGP